MLYFKDERAPAVYLVSGSLTEVIGVRFAVGDEGWPASWVLLWLGNAAVISFIDFFNLFISGGSDGFSWNVEGGSWVGNIVASMTVLLLVIGPASTCICGFEPWVAASFMVLTVGKSFVLFTSLLIDSFVVTFESMLGANSAGNAEWGMPWDLTPAATL